MRKNSIKLYCCFVLLALGVSAFGQEVCDSTEFNKWAYEAFPSRWQNEKSYVASFTQNKSRHSLELSFGGPSIIAMAMPNSTENDIAKGSFFDRQGGQEYYLSDDVGVPISLGLKWNLKRKMDFEVLVNITPFHRDKMRYTDWTVDGHYPDGGYWIAPEYIGTEHFIGYWNVSAIWKFKWGFWKWGHCYSALGVGLDAFAVQLPMFDIYWAPLCFSFGERGPVYGFLETCVLSGANTLFSAGLGIRLD